MQFTAMVWFGLVCLDVCIFYVPSQWAMVDRCVISSIIHMMNEWNKQTKWNGILANGWYACILNAHCTRTYTYWTDCESIVYLFCCNCVSIILWNMVYVGMEWNAMISALQSIEVEWNSLHRSNVISCANIYPLPHHHTFHIFNWTWFIFISLVFISHIFIC